MTIEVPAVHVTLTSSHTSNPLTQESEATLAARLVRIILTEILSVERD